MTRWYPISAVPNNSPVSAPGCWEMPGRVPRRGGIIPWPSAEKDILRHLMEDRGVMISLLVDYYGLPQSGTGAWPARAAAEGAGSVDAAILDRIGNRMGCDFHRSRFVPCVMMHEFEAFAV